MKKRIMLILSITFLVAVLVFSLNLQTIIGMKKSVAAPEPPEETEAFPSERPVPSSLLPTDSAEAPAPTPEPSPAPTPFRNGKIIYLTFDDGPYMYTEELLDILEQYNIKATFFVTDTRPEYEDLIGEEYSRGHSIGVHAYHHVWSEVYANEEAFYEDFQKMQEVVKEQTGAYTDIFRFPGGSSNQRTDHINKMMTHLANDMTEKGYVYFDWDLDSRDAMEAKTSSEVLTNLKSGAQKCKEYSVVLCHDVYEYTVKAMEEFIPWALEEGYQFQPLTADSPNAHHIIKN